MCGICGELITVRPGAAAGALPPPDGRLVARMCARLAHRGPDDQGLAIVGRAALGMRRLAVIDLAGGHQPLANEDGTVWVVLNGELYNYRALRRELARRGHRFRTQSDTEVLVHLYEELGERLVEPLRGMFAFALWDARRERLVLARDRLGEKPLLYACLPGRLRFASELGALLADPALPRQVDPLAIHHYLTLQYVPSPHSMLAAVRKLPPAHRLVWERGELRLERYWAPRPGPRLTLPYRELVAGTRARLHEAVRLRLVADVPLGAMLSGGVDSSAVVACMAAAAAEPVRTFTIAFAEGPYSEAAHARAVARALGTDHHELVLDPALVRDELPAIVARLDEPLADPAAVPLFALARLARRHVTVALTGDGGDELFGGYQRYAADPLAGLLALVPRPLRARLVAPLVQAAAALLRAGQPAPGALPPERDLAAALERLVAAAELPPDASVVRWGAYFSEPLKAALYDGLARAAAGAPATVALLAGCAAAAAWPGAGRLDRTLLTDLTTYLADGLLMKADRMTMAHGLEARAPLLDHELVEWVARAPEAAKVRGWQTKRLLRDAVRGLVPEPVRRRGKQGFGVPLAGWLRGPLLPLARELLLDSTARRRGYFRPALVEQLLAEHLTGRRDHAKRLWALLCLELWHRTVLESPVPAGATDGGRSAECEGRRA
ncbi:MAG: asparagine synthase (glutamine-hydrolyzing) [Firmicutes bacterium]|nr:asparagine synthase (glutamine-hydrolyzing) [Bacillota bacterium]